MVHLRGRRNAGDADDRIQAGGLFEVRRPEGQAAQIGEALHVALTILDGQEVIVAALGINPVARGNHAVGGQRRDQAVRDLLGAQPQLAGALAVNLDLQGRVIHILRYQHVAHPGQGAHLPGDLAGDVVQGPQVHAGDLDVQRRGDALVENRVHQAAGLEIGAELGQLAPDPLAHQAHVGKAAELVAFVETHLHRGGARAGVRIEDGVEAGRGADIGDDDLQIALGHDAAHNVLDAADKLLGEFQARAGGGLDADDELARVGAGKVGLADHRVEGQAEHEQAGDAQHRGHGPDQRDTEGALIAVEQSGGTCG